MAVSNNEELLLDNKHDSELTEDYKRMIDELLEQEERGEAKYVSAESIRERFQKTAK